MHSYVIFHYGYTLARRLYGMQRRGCLVNPALDFLTDGQADITWCYNTTIVLKTQLNILLYAL